MRIVTKKDDLKRKRAMEDLAIDLMYAAGVRIDDAGNCADCGGVAQLSSPPVIFHLATCEGIRRQSRISSLMRAWWI